MGLRSSSSYLKGYQQTELGVIPKDWQLVRLSDLMEFKNGVNADKSAYGSGIPFINVLEVITKSHLAQQDIPGKVSLPRMSVESYSIRRGDIVFNRTSETQDEVGLSAVYVGDKTIVFGGFVIRGRPTDNRLDTRYAGYGLRAPLIRSHLIAKGQGVIRANVGQSDLKQVWFALPTIAEQEAIAEALSDADALVESLEQLIAKKRHLKQGAIQELLRPNDGWVEKRLGNTAILKARIGWQDLTTAEYLDLGDFYLVTGTEFRDGYIDWSNCYYVDDSRYKQDKNIQLKEHDVLVTKDGTIGKVA